MSQQHDKKKCRDSNRIKYNHDDTSSSVLIVLTGVALKSEIREQIAHSIYLFADIELQDCLRDNWIHRKQGKQEDSPKPSSTSSNSVLIRIVLDSDKVLGNKIKDTHKNKKHKRNRAVNNPSRVILSCNGTFNSGSLDEIQISKIEI